MKGDAQPLIKFFDGSDKRFIIPLYQRNYDWKEENCEQLFQDLMKLHNSDRKSHFFGSIVSSIQPGNGMFEECNIPASEFIFEFRSDQGGEDEE